ncbi:MAG: hypothetical protein AAGJ54_02745, partial [Planctomycetota bacterium]
FRLQTMRLAFVEAVLTPDQADGLQGLMALWKAKVLRDSKQCSSGRVMSVVGRSNRNEDRSRGKLPVVGEGLHMA